MPPIERFSPNLIERISRVIGHTERGISHAEIGNHLHRCNIPDPEPGITKWKRLAAALEPQQRRDGCGNKIVELIQSVMDPVNYIDNRKLFEERQADLNAVLSFAGLAVDDQGKCRTAAKVHTLTEAEQRAKKLRTKLSDRNVHPDVLRFCEARWLDDNYFHAVLEATKSLAKKIRERTGLTEDGSALVDRAFGFRNQMPFLAFSRLDTETEKSEQTGLMSLMKGVFSAFRNPTAHEPEIEYPIEEQDALDILSVISLLHRRIDAAHRTTRTE